MPTVDSGAGFANDTNESIGGPTVVSDERRGLRVLDDLECERHRVRHRSAQAREESTTAGLETLALPPDVLL